MKSFLTLLSAAFFVTCVAFLHAERNAFSGAKVRTYSHDAKGLDKEFRPFLDVVATGDAGKLKETFAVFGLPNPDAWFAQYFAKDQVQQLVWDNEAELDGYRNSLTMLLRRFMHGPYYGVKCEQKLGADTTLKPRSDAVTPLTQVPTEQFSIKLSGADGHSMEQLSNFVYLDGAFRYVGKGAYPFWSMPDATRKSTQ